MRSVALIFVLLLPACASDFFRERVPEKVDAQEHRKSAPEHQPSTRQRSTAVEVQQPAPAVIPQPRKRDHNVEED